MNPTPHRTIRVPDDLWEPFKAKTKAQDTNATEVIKQLIKQWLEDH